MKTSKVKKERELRESTGVLTTKLTEQKPLKRRKPAAVYKVKKFLNIWKEKEDFIHSRKVGADAWQQTRVPTFDSNAQSDIQ